MKKGKHAECILKSPKHEEHGAGTIKYYIMKQVKILCITLFIFSFLFVGPNIQNRRHFWSTTLHFSSSTLPKNAVCISKCTACCLVHVLKSGRFRTESFSWSNQIALEFDWKQTETALIIDTQGGCFCLCVSVIVHTSEENTPGFDSDGLNSVYVK